MNARVLLTRLFFTVAAVAVLVLPACNTVSGAGRDISSVGHSMERSADKNK